jgi:hypothetical protein
MKTNFNLLKITGLIFGLIALIFFALRAGDVLNHKENKNAFKIMMPDSLRTPEGISEQRITQVTIVNGKKKVTETIIKMKGDSIIEKKVIEKEGDDIGDSPFKFEYRFGDGFDNDSLWSRSKDNFNFGVMPMDSLMKSFRFNFDGPSFNFNFDDDGFPKGFGEPLDLDGHSPFGHGDFDNLMDEMFKRYNFDSREIPGRKEYKNKSRSGATLSEIIRDNLLNDGFINDEDQKYKFEINEKGLKIDGKKQEIAIFNKYKKIIEDNTGVELGDEFSFNFTNNKKLEKNAKKI